MTTTRYSERCQVQQLLRALGDTDELEFPVCLEHRDKPDFILSTRTRRIGLEASSFTDEEVRRAQHLASARFPNAFIPNAFATNMALPNHRGCASNDQIVDTIFNWEALGEDVVESAEHIAREIFKTIKAKRRQFSSATFEKFDENWLLLSDYFNPFSDWITEDILARHFGAAGKRKDVFGAEFDRIYIFYGPRLFRLLLGCS